jgi:hypothetical protein
MFDSMKSAANGRERRSGGYCDIGNGGIQDKLSQTRREAQSGAADGNGRSTEGKEKKDCR